MRKPRECADQAGKILGRREAGNHRDDWLTFLLVFHHAVAFDDSVMNGDDHLLRPNPMGFESFLAHRGDGDDSITEVRANPLQNNSQAA